MVDENMREGNGRVGEGTEWKSNEAVYLIERAIMKLERNLMLLKFPGINKHDPS